jgi:hypothetical protein
VKIRTLALTVSLLVSSPSYARPTHYTEKDFRQTCSIIAKRFKAVATARDRGATPEQVYQAVAQAGKVDETDQYVWSKAVQFDFGDGSNMLPSQIYTTRYSDCLAHLHSYYHSQPNQTDPPDQTDQTDPNYTF